MSNRPNDKRLGMANIYRNPHSKINKYTDTYDYISSSKYVGSLKGKVVLITGAGRGIGRATAFAFAAAGASVACIARTRSDIENVVKEIEEKGYPRCIAIEADVTDAAAPAQVVKEVEKELGPVAVMVNNAGISRISDIEHEKDMMKAWNVIDVNMRGTMAFIYAVLPSMIEHKSGTIINVCVL